MLDLEPIKARLAEATPGPWKYLDGKLQASPGWPIIDAWWEGEGKGGITADAADAALIANAPSDIAALIREVEQLRTQLDESQPSV